MVLILHAILFNQSEMPMELGTFEARVRNVLNYGKLVSLPNNMLIARHLWYSKILIWPKRQDHEVCPVVALGTCTLNNFLLKLFENFPIIEDVLVIHSYLSLLFINYVTSTVVLHQHMSNF